MLSYRVVVVKVERIEMHLKTHVVATLVVLAVAGCSGSLGSTSGSLPQTANAASATLREASSVTLSEARSTSEYQAQAMAYSPVVRSSADLLYVGNTGNNSISVYKHDVSGNTPPLRVISGSNTGISSPGQLSQDVQGNLYVANGYLNTRGTSPAILEFAHGANGNVAPVRKLAGPLTGMNNVEAMTVDQTTGKIFVIDSEPDASGFAFFASLLRFCPNATGNTAPFARSAPTLYRAFQLASDSTGQNVIEAHMPASQNADYYGIDTLVKQFPNNASLKSIDDVYATLSQGVVDDPTTKTYLETSPGGIYRLAEKTAGRGPFSPAPEDLKPSAVSIITSDTCGTQLALGYLRNIYVTHSKQPGQLGRCATDAVYVYAPAATGNATPLRILSGSATRLNAPYGIYEGK